MEGGRETPTVSRIEGRPNEQLTDAQLTICTTSSMGPAGYCFGVATSMSPSPLASRAGTGPIGGSSSRSSFPSESELVVAEPAWFRTQRPGG